MATGRPVWFEHLLLRLAALNDGVWVITLLVENGTIKWSIRGGERLEQ